MLSTDYTTKKTIVSATKKNIWDLILIIGKNGLRQTEVVEDFSAYCSQFIDG